MLINPHRYNFSLTLFFSSWRQPWVFDYIHDVWILELGINTLEQILLKFLYPFAKITAMQSVTSTILPMRTISAQTTRQNVHWFLIFKHFLSTCRTKILTHFTRTCILYQPFIIPNCTLLESDIEHFFYLGKTFQKLIYSKDWIFEKFTLTCILSWRLELTCIYYFFHCAGSFSPILFFCPSKLANVFNSSRHS